jgi:hypothetical protein
MFPNIIYGDYGDEKVTSSAKIGNLPLGIKMVLPDGREFRHAHASAAGCVAGDLYQQNSMAAVAGTSDANLYAGLAVAASAAIGATSLTVTMAGTAAVSKDLLADCYLLVATSSGQGLSYKIKGNTAAGSTVATTISLDEKDPLKVALAASSTKVGFRQNSYDNILLTTADTVATGVPAGIVPVAVAASYYCWVQRRGPAPALTDATLVIGQPVVASSAVAGAVAPFISSTTAVIKNQAALGWAISVAASASYSLVYLTLD